MKNPFGLPQGIAFLAWFASVVLLTIASGWEWSFAYVLVLIVFILTALSLYLSVMGAGDH